MSKKSKETAARHVYQKGFKATEDELKVLGFKQQPSKEYLKEEVLMVLADGYCKLLGKYLMQEVCDGCGKPLEVPTVD